MSGQSSYGFSYSYAPSLYALSISLAIIDIIVVGLRLFTRRKQKLVLGVDDYLSVAALIATLGCAAICIAGATMGALGYPTPDFDLSDPAAITTVNWAIRITSQCEWAMDILSVVALGLIKLSFLFFLRRVFCTGVSPRAPFSIATWVLIGVVTVWIVTFFVGWLAICGDDPAAWWGPFTGLLQKCGHAYRFLCATAISDVILDVIIVFLPIPMIWSLHLSVQKKIAITSVFMVGIVVIAASVSRMVLVLRSSSTATIDEDLYITNVLWWTMFELGMSLLGSCLSSLHPLVPEISGHRILHSLKATMSRVSFARSGSRRPSQESASEGFGRAQKGSQDSFKTKRASFEFRDPKPLPTGHHIMVQHSVDIERQ